MDITVRVSQPCLLSLLLYFVNTYALISLEVITLLYLSLWEHKSNGEVYIGERS
jgi:hypothetical protein